MPVLRKKAHSSANSPDAVLRPTSPDLQFWVNRLPRCARSARTATRLCWIQRENMYLQQMTTQFVNLPHILGGRCGCGSQAMKTLETLGSMKIATKCRSKQIGLRVTC